LPGTATSNTAAKRSGKQLSPVGALPFSNTVFQVRPTRIDSYQFNAAQRKTVQEVITLGVFAVFSVT